MLLLHRCTLFLMLGSSSAFGGSALSSFSSEVPSTSALAVSAASGSNSSDVYDATSAPSLSDSSMWLSPASLWSSSSRQLSFSSILGEGAYSEECALNLQRMYNCSETACDDLVPGLSIHFDRCSKGEGFSTFFSAWWQAMCE